jgi:chromosome partitioning protein
MDMKVISFVNMKGGVAKTTLAVNVADALVRRNGSKVLIVDIDPQFNATQCLVSGPDYVERLKAAEHTILEVFDDSPRPVASSITGRETAEQVRIEDICPWEIKENLHLLAGNLELYRLEMGAGQGRENRLKRYVEHLRSKGDYDFVVIDTPPTPSAWMASALIASDYYLVPVKPEPLSATGIDLLRSVVGKIEENHGLNIRCLGVVLTIAETHTVVYKNTVDFIDTNRYWKGKRFRRPLPKRTQIARSQGEQRAILDIDDPDLLTAVTGIMKEFLTRIEEDANN